MLDILLKHGTRYTGNKYPKYGETTDIDQQNGIWHCYRCGYEW